MRRSTIAGTLGLAELAVLAAGAVDHEQRAQHHRPTDPAVLAAEIRRLHGSGLSARDIAAAMRVNLANVITIINTPRS